MLTNSCFNVAGNKSKNTPDLKVCLLLAEIIHILKIQLLGYHPSVYNNL